MNEYPKWITAPGNRRMIVKSAEQERAVMETPYYDEDHLSPEARGVREPEKQKRRGKK